MPLPLSTKPEKSVKPRKSKKLRHAEYYDMTETLDRLYSQSQKGAKFNKLMEIIASEENIKLAYRNIKKNKGSHTPGVDKKTIEDLGKIPIEQFTARIQNKLAWYQPKPVKRVEIPKPDGRTRPLGIPTIEDRIIQQCILQVLEPICEAKFHERSNGFRPNRSAEHAIAQCYRMIQKSHLHFVVNIDIKGFFDNVNHCKLKKQIWSMGIQDKNLICIITKMLKAPIVLPGGSIEHPTKGTPQGGILSPLLSNIVLNELDWWITSQWEEIPTRKLKYTGAKHDNGTISKGDKYKALRNTKLKEVYIVRYADDFKIFCRTRQDAEKIFHATKKWLKNRLKLEISEEKSKIVNLKKSYSEFLGFKLKAVPKGNKWVVKSHMSNKAVKNCALKLKEGIKDMQTPKNADDEYQRLQKYNSLVWGIHNYYKIATHISADCKKIHNQIRILLKNRLNKRLTKNGNPLTEYIAKQYGKSKQIRYLGGNPICPIGYVQTKNPMHKKKSICKYTPEGRKEIHKNLGIDVTIMHQLMTAKHINRSIEYMDNRISLYAAQNGTCAITGTKLELEYIHCHHKLPVSLGGKDNYQNLIIVHKNVHQLIHAQKAETIQMYMDIIGNIDNTMLKQINKLRKMAKLDPISLTS